MEKKKINIRLDKELYSKIETIRKKEGITKSHLINTYISNSRKSNPGFNFNKTDLRSKSFSIFTSDYDYLKDTSIAHQRSINSIVISIIENNINSYLNSVNFTNQINFEDKFSEGNFSEIVSTNINIDSISARDLVLFLRSCIYLDKKSLFDNYLPILEEKIKYSSRSMDYVDYYLLMSKKYLTTGQFDIAKSWAEKALGKSLLLKYRYGISKSYMYMADCCSSSDDFEKFKEFIEKSIEYIDPINFPVSFSRCYTNLASIYAYENNLELSNKYIEKASSFLKNIPNEHLNSPHIQVKGINAYLKGDYMTALENLNDSLYLRKKTMNVNRLDYLYEKIGRVYLLANNPNKAHFFFSKAEANNSFANEIICISTIMKLSIEAKHSYDDSISKMKKEMEKVNVKPLATKYVYLSTILEHSSNDSEIKDAETELKRLAYENGYKLISQSALNTLKTKQLQPFR